MIVSGHLRGASIADLAVSNGLSERQCRNIIRSWREAGVASLDVEDQRALVFEFIERYREIEDGLAEVAEMADNSAAAVGAYRGRTEAIDRQVALMQATGLLPKAANQLRVQADVRGVAARIVSIFREHHVGEEIEQAVVAALTQESS